MRMRIVSINEENAHAEVECWLPEDEDENGEPRYSMKMNYPIPHSGGILAGPGEFFQRMAEWGPQRQLELAKAQRDKVAQPGLAQLKEMIGIKHTAIDPLTTIPDKFTTPVLTP